MSVGAIYPLSDQLQVLAATTMEDQLCSGPPMEQDLLHWGSGFHLSPPIECVAYGGGLVAGCNHLHKL